MLGREPKQRTSADIIGELQAAMVKAVAELGERRDITMEAVHTSAFRIMPEVAMLVVQSVGRRRAQNDAKAQGATADVMAHGGVQNKPPATLSEALNLTPAQRLANTVASARKIS